jgi:hypothetical protein
MATGIIIGGLFSRTPARDKNETKKSGQPAVGDSRMTLDPQGFASLDGSLAPARLALRAACGSLPRAFPRAGVAAVFVLLRTQCARWILKVALIADAPLLHSPSRIGLEVRKSAV